MIAYQQRSFRQTMPDEPMNDSFTTNTSGVPKNCPFGFEKFDILRGNSLIRYPSIVTVYRGKTLFITKWKSYSKCLKNIFIHRRLLGISHLVDIVILKFCKNPQTCSGEQDRWQIRGPGRIWYARYSSSSFWQGNFTKIASETVVLCCWNPVQT